MPPKPAESLLFHKKRPVVKKSSTPTPSGSQNISAPGSPRKSAPPHSQPTRQEIDADDGSRLPEGEFSEYKLMSSALNGWKYDVMKFDSRKPIELSTWEAPIKLNRKELRRPEVTMGQVPVGPMLGADGKPVIGSDGNLVMVDAEGRPISNSGGEGSSKEGKEKLKDALNGNRKRKMQKKTRQVFKASEEARQLKREERYPWVLEDARRNEVWVGKLEDVSKAEIHALFVPAEKEVFKFVPAHRWYKFQKKPKHYIPNLEEAESLMAKIQKNKDPERWLLHKRNGQGPSAATAAMFKADPEGATGAPIVYSASQSKALGGRSLMSVNRGSRGPEEDEEGNLKRPKQEDDGEGHLDEQLFEDDVADDDEHEAHNSDDEEAKELEERLKKEYKLANKQREGYVDESEEEGESQLTRDGKSLKKLMRKLEKNAVYESDEERNPYASSGEEEEEEPQPVSSEPAIQQQPQQVKARPASQPSPSKPPQASANGSGVGSRTVSPAPTPGMGGHSVVAKRATSPKAPKPSVSRGNSPSIGSAAVPSRVGSPFGSRATSPTATAGKSSGHPPPGGALATNKRKAADDLSGAVSPTSTSNGTAAPKPKKRKPLPSGPLADGELEERMLIEWLQNTPNATTRDCIQHFTPYLTSEAKKTKFTAMVKEVAQLKGGILILKSGLRGGSAALSPSPTGAM